MTVRHEKLGKKEDVSVGLLSEELWSSMLWTFPKRKLKDPKTLFGVRCVVYYSKIEINFK